MKPGFAVRRRSGRARLGRLETAHGPVETPAFMPVATGGAIRGLTSAGVAATGTRILLSNAWHLMLQPGDERIAELGGLHRLMAWDRPILTDSGGYQVASLATLRKISETGVHLRSYRDGSPHELTPERAVEIQRNLGSDIAMVLDECLALPAPPDEVERAAARSLRWAERSLAAPRAPGQLLFGIVQGGTLPGVRRENARALLSLGPPGEGFDGFGIGGLLMGEPTRDTRRMTELSADVLGEERPRYLMGAGLPADLIESAGLGVDLFDSVIPTRLARRGIVFTSTGRLNISRAPYRDDAARLDGECECLACRDYCRAWLHHLLRARERIAATLLSAHNLTFYAGLMARMREAIAADRFAEFHEENRRRWSSKDTAA
ncbi:MAG: tRNA guanosine(34) transglycosylase Tgt [Acidobacteria bacterium]|nr:tRNA guanosine(34) transglycosylase Tgt [Acidobacteriota bacterium]MYG76684.1 tRNA guanosine(34) transglycosylase Tgt [Acidobacteriota bacterium]